MAWVRIDDQFPEHPKVAQAGPLAMAMQVAGLCYCNRKLTDGFVPRSIARRLLDFEVIDADGKIHTIGVTSGMSGEDISPEWVIGLLLDAGMWEKVSGGYLIHDYHDYQPSKDDVEADREAARDRMRNLRANKRVNKKRSSDDVRANNERSSSTPVPEGSNEPLGARKKRACQLPDSWEPTEKHAALAAEMGVSLEVEVEQFRDHHRAKGSTYKDWDAAFRTWLRNAPKFSNGKATPITKGGRRAGVTFDD